MPLTSSQGLYLKPNLSSSFKDSDWLHLGHMFHSLTNHYGW